MSVTASPRGFSLIISAALLSGCGAALADVTIEDKTSVDISFIKANGTSSEWISTGKKRHDSQLRCDGMMSWVCGKVGGGEIIRLDKNMSYLLEPDKKRFHEQPLPTEAQRKQMQQRIAAAAEKMKQCVAQQPAAKPAVDTSKCELSPPKIEVRNLGDDGQIIGHGVHRSAVTLTQSCANKDTGDVCDLQYGFDVWLTSDQVAGFEDRAAFEKAYLTKLGLTGEEGVQLQQQVRQMLAPYAEQMRELSARSGDLKGQPLRTAFHLAYGGAHCAAAAKARESGAPSSTDLGQAARDAAVDSTASVAAEKVAGQGAVGAIASRTLSSVSGKLSGLFSKKKPADGAAAAPAAAEAASSEMFTVVKFTTEVTAVRTDPVPATQFEIPADWKRIVPKPGVKEEGPSCDKPEK